MRIRKNDQVVVITGKHKGKVGKVLKVMPADQKVIVEGVNVVKRHTKPTQANPTGGIVDKEMPIHISNVMLFDSKANKGTRVRMRTLEDGRKVRVAAASDTVLD